MKLKLAITFPTLTRPVKRARFGRSTSLFLGSNCHLFRLVNGLYDTPYTLSRRMMMKLHQKKCRRVKCVNYHLKQGTLQGLFELNERTCFELILELFTCLLLFLNVFEYKLVLKFEQTIKKKSVYFSNF